MPIYEFVPYVWAMIIVITWNVCVRIEPWKTIWDSLPSTRHRAGMLMGNYLLFFLPIDLACMVWKWHGPQWSKFLVLSDMLRAYEDWYDEHTWDVMMLVIEQEPLSMWSVLTLS